MRPAPWLALCALVGADGAAAEALGLELNRLLDIGGGCAATFVVTNPGHAALTALTFEAVVFDAEGRVAQFTLFEMGAVPAGSRRVREFVVPGGDCEGLSAILINGTAACAPAGTEACRLPPKLDSRVPVALE